MKWIFRSLGCFELFLAGAWYADHRGGDFIPQFCVLFMLGVMAGFLFAVSEECE